MAHARIRQMASLFLGAQGMETEEEDELEREELLTLSEQWAAIDARNEARTG